MATRPKAVIESRNGEKFSPITIAKNVLTDDGQNLHDILSDRKEDMMTPTIENSSSMFKVGQGDNVDYSNNVINGAYESMVLKGKTMVNCIQEPSSQDVVLPYEFNEGQYVTINDTKESGALGVELKGQTLVNLAPRKIIDYTASNDWDGFNVLVQNSKKPNEHWRTLQDLKPSTKYYISCYVETFEDVNGRDYYLNNSSHNCLFVDSMKVNGVGHYQWISTTRSELTDEIFIALRCQNSYARGRIKIRDIMIIEYQEGMENWDIPYFEGMASCKMPILHTVGKNLFDIGKDTNHCWQGITEFVDGRIKVTSTHNDGVTFHRTYNIPVKKGRTYHVNVNREGNGHWYLWKNGDTTKSLNNPFTVDDTFDSVAIGLYCAIGEGNVCYFKPQIEEGTVATTYEPHKSSSLSLPEEVVLRSLPNGVCDTFNTRTGVYTQRIYETTLVGTEEWISYDASNTNRQNTIAFSINLGLGDVFDNNETYSKIGGVVCDKLNHINSVWGTDKDNEGISADQRNVVVQIKKTRLASENVTGFKAWLASDNLKVGIQLATPIVTKIPLSSTLKSWNTTTHIYSEIPENTLYPILSHSNPSYPVILKPSTKYSIVANSYSNNHTNSAINFNLGGATASTTVGNRVTTITTPSILSNELLTMSGRSNKLNNVMVIEGDVVGDEPYFEGICDCKSPILSNVGKNLINALNCSVRMGATILSKEQNCITFKAPNVWGGLTYHLYLKPNTTYTFSFERDSVDTKGYVRYKAGMSDWSGGYGGGNEYTFTTDGLGVVMFTIESATVRDSVTVKNIMIEEATTKNLYEPYKSNTTTFEQKDGKTIVLRSLPNGVCDTLNVETGEYVQRIGEVILNGSENWMFYGATGGGVTTAFKLSLTGHISAWISGNGYCDKLKFVSGDYIYSTNNEGITTDANNFIIRILNEKASTIEELKSYLQSNPLTVQYELVTPIVKTVDLSGYPFSYENGHVILSSGSIEQSLTPKVEYSVITNRNGQIRSNQKMVERQQKQLDRLQAMILTNLVNTQYEQTLTNLKYDLKNVREEVK